MTKRTKPATPVVPSIDIAAQTAAQVLAKAGPVEFYHGMFGGHYWRVRAANGRIVAVGGEGYVSEAMARKGFAAARGLMAKAKV